jgi:prepilin-type N-terminal cleavage/methylation domain-containing protein
MRRAHGEPGFTMIELMMALAVLGILATLAVVAYTRNLRKARAAEVPQMFGELSTKQEAYRAENGVYLSACPNPGIPSATSVDCNENDYFPTPLPGKGQAMAVGTLPNRWVVLRVAPGRSSLYCQYNLIAAPAGFSPTNLGPTGQLLYPTAPIQDYYYMLARCDWDGDPTVMAAYAQRGDSSVLGVDNEGK